MKPKEKAQELVAKYYQLAESIEWTDNDTKVKAEKFNDELGSDVLKYWNELAKKSALIAIYEIIKSKELRTLFTQEQIDSMEGTSDDRWIYETFMKYWEQVKHEIEKL